MRQEWANIVWCHWPVPVDAVRAILPEGLEPDCFEGHAWVGLIPFSMRDLRAPRPLGAITKWLRSANFGEVNVRTYVKGPDGGTGVWFCTLDADSWVGVACANIAFGLPYRQATTAYFGDSHTRHWHSRRRRDGRRAELRVAISDEPPRLAAPGLEQFLFERYSLYSAWHGRIVRGDLFHAPWQIRPATLEAVCDETVRAAGFNVEGPAHVFVGEPVEVTVFPMRIVRRRTRRSRRQS
jgi:uncharacterized protein YqjF (DUF2071 family)